MIITSSVIAGICILAFICYFLYGTFVIWIASGGGRELFSLSNRNIPYIESSIGCDELVTINILSEEVERILKNYGFIDSGIEVYDNEWAKSYTIINENDDISLGKVLFSAGGISVNLEKYKEIEAMIDIWLFITEHQTSEHFIGVCFGFIPTRMMIGNTTINISTFQFEEFYKKANVEDLSRREKIEILTKLWVEKVGYDRQTGIVDITPMIE